MAACEACGAEWCDSCRIFPPPKPTRKEVEDARKTHRWRIYGKKMIGRTERVYHRCVREGCNARVIKEKKDKKIRWYETYTHSPTIKSCKHS